MLAAARASPRICWDGMLETRHLREQGMTFPTLWGRPCRGLSSSRQTRRWRCQRDIVHKDWHHRTGVGQL